MTFEFYEHPRGLTAMVLGIVNAELDKLPRKARVQIIEATLRHAPVRSPGRPRAIEPAALERLRARFKEQAERELRHHGRLPRPQSKKTVELLRRWAEEESADRVDDRTLQRQISEPVLREMKAAGAATPRDR